LRSGVPVPLLRNIRGKGASARRCPFALLPTLVPGTKVEARWFGLPRPAYLRRRGLIGALDLHHQRHDHGAPVGALPDELAEGPAGLLLDRSPVGDALGLQLLESLQHLVGGFVEKVARLLFVDEPPADDVWAGEDLARMTVDRHDTDDDPVAGQQLAIAKDHRADVAHTQPVYENRARANPVASADASPAQLDDVAVFDDRDAIGIDAGVLRKLAVRMKVAELPVNGDEMLSAAAWPETCTRLVSEWKTSHPSL
jgi:hypothetical protein